LRELIIPEFVQQNIHLPDYFYSYFDLTKADVHGFTSFFGKYSKTCVNFYYLSVFILSNRIWWTFS